MKQPPHKAYAAYLDAKWCLPTVLDEETGEHRYTPEAIGGMQRAILYALRADGPLPEEIRMDLAFAFEEICAGIFSDLLTPVKRGGGRERPIAKHMQADAIRYLRWVEDGRIQDRSPTKTVAEAYEVGERTVRNWQTAWGDIPTPSINEVLGEVADKPGIDYEKLAYLVTRFMKVSGKQYRRFVPKPEPRR